MKKPLFGLEAQLALWGARLNMSHSKAEASLKHPFWDVEETNLKSSFMEMLEILLKEKKGSVHVVVPQEEGLLENLLLELQAKGMDVCLLQEEQQGNIVLGKSSDWVSLALQQKWGGQSWKRSTVLLYAADQLLLEESVPPVTLTLPQAKHPWVDLIPFCHGLISELEAEKDYQLTPSHLSLFETGHEKLNRVVSRDTPAWSSPSRREDFLKPMLVARDLYKRGEHYDIEDEMVVIHKHPEGVTFNSVSGILQALQVLNGLEISPPQVTLDRMGFQRFCLDQSWLGGVGCDLGRVETDIVCHLRSRIARLREKKTNTRSEVSREHARQRKEQMKRDWKDTGKVPFVDPLWKIDLRSTG